MTLGGVSNVRPGGNTGGQGPNGSGVSGSGSGGEEFSLEKQAAGKTELIKSHDISKVLGKNARIVDRKKRNRKGAPRTIIVDGEIYEVFLLAIA